MSLYITHIIIPSARATALQGLPTCIGELNGEVTHQAHAALLYINVRQ